MSRNTWDRQRFLYERDRDRQGDERIRYEEDDHYYRGGSRHRDLSVDDRYERRHSRPYEDDLVIRDSRRVYYDDEPRHASRHRSPPPELERDRHVVIQRDRIARSPSPPNRPAFLRRQSSLDTFDRRPKGYHVEEERYGPPARIPREEFRPRPYEPIPLPRTRALPPPRRYADREYYDEIRVSDPDYYGDEEFRTYPERVREREVIRTKKRDVSPSVKSAKSSRTGRSHSHRASTVRSHSRSSTGTSSSSGSSGGTTVTVKSEYPKKGKTRIPARLVSKRALIDLGYPFIEEGHTVVVLKALGQDNIDDLLKLSEDYKKSRPSSTLSYTSLPLTHIPGELEVFAARSEAGDIIEERKETIIEALPPPPPPMQALPPPPPSMVQPPPPIFMQPPPPPPPPAAEVVEKRTIIRDVSPARSYTTSASGTTHTSATPYVEVRRREEISEEVPVGPLALVHSSRSRSRSRSHREIRSEIKDLERQLHASRRGERELVKAERLSSGELVLYEEQIEKIEEPRRGVRIEKDKKGRMSISVPKYR